MANELPESSSVDATTRYRIGVLLYFRNEAGDLLLIKRRRTPHVGLWCAIGGKLEMKTGESPFECACREGSEEVGVELLDEDLKLRCMVAEKDYEGTGHWLMFIFEVQKRLVELPEEIDEGEFGFFSIESLEELDMPPLDRKILLERVLSQETSKMSILRMDDGVMSANASILEEETIG